MATYGLKSITVGSNTYEMNTKNALGISLNGGSLSFDGSTANQSVTFYAPTTAGTSGYYLKSNGSGAPTWAQIPAGVTITLNGSTTTTPSFYAPTASGTSGKIIGWDTTNSVPAWIDAPNTGIQNLVDGSSTGSVRGIGTGAEDSNYTIGQYAFAEGNGTYANGNGSHAEGQYTISAGDSSHAEGYDTRATGPYSHAEGYGTIASGNYGHAEGSITTASGDYSHAEGYYTTASGDYSHANGYKTTAQRRSQTVIGEFNALDTSGDTTTRGTYAFIIGKGTSNNARSNALTVSWNGDTVMAGGLDVSGIDHTITTAEYEALIDAIDAI